MHNVSAYFHLKIARTKTMNWSIENPDVGVDHGALPKMWLWTMVVSGLVPSNLSHRSAGFLLTNIEPWWSHWFLALNRLLWALGTSEKHKPSWFMDPEGLIETFCIPEQKIWTHVKYLEKIHSKKTSTKLCHTDNGLPWLWLSVP